MRETLPVATSICAVVITLWARSTRGNASAHQLRGAQPGDDDELERVGAVRTLNHETCFFLRLW